MTEFSQVLFEDGHATPLMLGRLRAKEAAKPLSPDARLTENGEATPYFSAWWREAFPDRAALPRGQLHLADGTITIAFHRVWR